MPSATGKKLTRIFYATDIHGSERCFKKFIAAAKLYKVDTLILGGDITGKMIVPIVEQSDGTYRSNLLGETRVLRTKDEAKLMEKRIKDSGFYAYYTNSTEVKELAADKTRMDQLFMNLMKQSLLDWVSYAEEHLKDTNLMCYITGGNDDAQEVIDVFKDTAHVKNPDDKVVYVDDVHEMASLGWGNPTPWKTPRECSEDQLKDRIESLVTNVGEMANAIFNFHVPPIDSDLDTAPKLDTSVYPPKPVVKGGEPVWTSAGSTAVKEAIEKHQPLLALVGHIHESRGVADMQKTVVINPGSDYGEGTLRGAIVSLADKKVVSYQLTSG